VLKTLNCFFSDGPNDLNYLNGLNVSHASCGEGGSLSILHGAKTFIHRVTPADARPKPFSQAKAGMTRRIVMMNNISTHGPTNRTLAVIDGGLNFKAGVQPPPSALKPKLLDQVRDAIRTRHYSYMTEKAYVHWIKRFIFFHNSDIQLRWLRQKLVGFFRRSQAISKSALPRRIRLLMLCYSYIKKC
jgi:UDP-2,3-diacylglucosamine pyrophosphatase LpxH